MRTYRKITQLKPFKYSGCHNGNNKNKPNIIICHVGTNNIINNIDTVMNYQAVINKIIRKSPKTKIAISSIIKRYDRKNIVKKVTSVYEKLQKCCEKIKSII